MNAQQFDAAPSWAAALPVLLVAAAIVVVPILLLRKRGWTAMLFGLLVSLIAVAACGIAALVVFGVRSAPMPAATVKTSSDSDSACALDSGRPPDAAVARSGTDGAAVSVTRSPTGVEMVAGSGDGTARVAVDPSGVEISARRAKRAKVPSADNVAARSKMPRMIIAGAALVLLILIAYQFVDARRYARYTWLRRGLWATAFAVVCLLMWRAGPLMR